MRLRSKLPARMALLVAALACGAAPPPSTEALAATADVAVHAAVLGSRIAEANGYLFTVYTVETRADLFNAPAARFEIWQPGGIDRERNIGMLVPGAPQFAPGEEAVVFLYRSRSGRLHALAGEAGVRRVRTAADREAAEEFGRTVKRLRRGESR